MIAASAASPTETPASAIRINPNAMAGINTHALVLDWFRGKSGVVADVGAGLGALSVELARLGFDVRACDRDRDAFRAHGVANIRFEPADLDVALPFGDSSVDFACAIEVIEHLENPRHLMRECRRILRDGGTVVLSTPNILNVVSHLTLLSRGSLIYFSQKEYASNHHITPVSLQDFQNICAEVGFEIVRVDYNAGKLPIPKVRHWLPLLGRPFRNRWLGESLMVWATKTRRRDR